ncbi:hypothetical protein [Nocardia sp. NPDC057227]|uniref:hypothetical protein n=1 Tax=Nocardia sp. NPDC057227 TaxID=3346056 RepID=UPI00362F5E4A
MLCCVLGMAVLAAISSVFRAPIRWWRGGVPASGAAFPPAARFGQAGVALTAGAVP